MNKKEAKALAEYIASKLNSAEDSAMRSIGIDNKYAYMVGVYEYVLENVITKLGFKLEDFKKPQ